jgi:hypothetical protein
LRLRDPIEGALVTWNPRGRPAGKEFFEPERPVEATKINAARIKVCNKVKNSAISQETASQEDSYAPGTNLPSSR